MKCPLEYVEEFSEWSTACQDCQYYQECMNKSYDIDKSEKPNMTGENFPIYEDLHFRMKLNKDRQSMIKKLLNADKPKITQDDVTDIIIDIEIYNKQCRKNKIKRQYNKRTKQDDSV